jgi:hypothetical protein
VAAGGTILALATIPHVSAAAPTGALDQVFGLIEAHRTADAAHLAALEEQSQPEAIGDPEANWLTAEPCHAAMDAFNQFIETAPTTFAGLRASASYLDGIRLVDPSMFEEEGPALVATFAEVLGNLAVTS